MLISVCMFCKTVYGIKPGRGVSGVSHGVCPACEPLAMELLERGVGVEKTGGQWGRVPKMASLGGKGSGNWMKIFASRGLRGLR